MKTIKLCVYFLLLLSLFPTPAYAYIDPGIGSMMLQGLLAGLVTMLVFWQRLRNRITTFFKGKGKRKEKDETVDE